MLFNNLLESLLQLAKKSQIPIDLACANFKNAIIRTFEIYDTDRKIDINIDVDKNVLDISEVYTVIPDNVDDYDDIIEMPINEAKKIVSDCKVGDTIKKTIDLNSIISDRSFYERLAKNMRLSNNIERNKKVFEKYKNEKGKIVRKRVETYQPTVGGIVEYDKDIKAEIIHDNTIPREQLIPNTEYDFYVCDVIEQPREWPIQLSRSAVELVTYYFKKEVPEIADGTIEIVRIARIAGRCTKVIIKSNNPNVDPIASVLGLKNFRLNNIQKLINNERINIIRYYPDFNNTLLSTLNSSDIISYLVEDGENEKDKKNITVVCPIDKQRQLLGPSGENIRICSQLLNARIEIINPEEAEYLTNDKELKNNQFIPADYSNIKIIRPRHSLTSEERATSASRRSNSANITNNRDGEVNSTNGSRPPRSGGRSNARSSSINEFISTEDRKKQQLEINKFKRNDIDEDEE